MNTSHFWPPWALGLTALSEPYQTTSARPGPPALIHGKMLTMGRGARPLPARAALTYAWRWVGSRLLPTQATKRLRALSIDATTKLAASPASAGTPLAMVIRRLGSPHGLAVDGASRKVRFPAASGVPMLRSMLALPVPGSVGPKAAWKTLPVTRSIAGYPSAPKGA